MPDVTIDGTNITISFPDSMTEDQIGQALATNPQIRGLRTQALAARKPSYGATFGDLRRIEAGHTTTAENIAQLQAQYGLSPQVLKTGGTHAAFEATAQAQKEALAFQGLKAQAIRNRIANPDFAPDYNAPALSTVRKVAQTLKTAPGAPSTVGAAVNRALGPGTFEALSQMKGPAAGLAQGVLSFAEPESLTLFGGTAPLGLVPGGSLALLSAFGSGAAKGAYQRYQSGDTGGALGELAAFLLPFGIHGARSYARAGLPLPDITGRFAPDIGPIGYGGDPALRQMFGLPDLTAPAAAEPAPAARARARAPVLGLPEAEPAAPPVVQTSEQGAPAALPVSTVQNAPVFSPATKLEPNSVFYRVVDHDGNLLGILDAPFDGTKADAIQLGKEAMESAYYHFGNKHSQIQSFLGATDAEGNPKWVINAHAEKVYDVGSQEAQYHLGDLSAAPPAPEVTTKAPADLDTFPDNGILQQGDQFLDKNGNYVMRYDGENKVSRWLSGENRWVPSQLTPEQLVQMFLPDTANNRAKLANYDPKLLPPLKEMTPATAPQEQGEPTNAVQVEGPAGQVPSPVGAGENLPPGGEGVRPGVEGTQPAGAGVTPETAAPVETAGGEAERTPSGILKTKGANDHAAEEREALGLPPLPESEKRAMTQAWELSLEQNGAASALPLAQKVITNPVNLSDVETASVVQRMMELKKTIKGLLEGIENAVNTKDEATANALKQQFDDTLAEYDTLDYARKLAGREWARAGLARQVVIDEYNFTGVRQRMLAANPKPLTEAERTQIGQLTARIDELETALKAREAAAARAPRKMTRAEQAASGAAFGEGNTIFTREKFDAARDRLRAKLSVPGGGKTNIAANIAELLPDLLEIGGYYAEGLARAGAAKFPAWSKAMRAHFGQDLPLSDADLQQVWDKVRSQIPETKRTMTPEQRLKGATTRKKAAIADLEERIRTGNLEPTKRPRVAINDPEYRKLEQEHARLKKQIDGLIQARAKKGFLGTLTRFQRFALLSGLPTLGKLGAAVTARAISTPLEEAAGGLISKALPRLAAKAPREGGISAAAEISAIKRMFSKQTLLDMKDKLQTGVNSLDVALGDKHIVADRSLLDLWGRVHGAIKTPAQRNEFFRSYVKRLQHAERLGLDTSDPAVHEQITAGAYADSMRAILLGDSWVTQQFSAFLGQMERSGRYGKPVATAFRLAVPIAKVPQNYVGEVGQYIGGAAKGLAQTAAAGKVETLRKQGVRQFFREAIDNLSPDEADAVLRAYKKNSLGAAAMALGYYLGPSTFGGFYAPGQKKKTGGKPGFEDIKVGPVTIPHYLLHNPLFESMQVGATVRRAMDDRSKGGYGAAAHQVAYGLGTQTPFIEEPIRLARAAESPQSAGKVAGTIARDVTIPLAVQQAAAALDRQGGQPVQRKARGFREEIMMGIPYPLPFNRRNVPRKTR